MSATPSQPEPPERAGLLLEYGALREEILKRVDLRHQILSITLTLAGVFLGIGLSDGGANAPIALVYPALAALLAMGWGQNESRVRELATYVRQRLEPRIPGLGWETHMDSVRGAHGDHAWHLAIASHGGVFLCTQGLAIAVGLFHLGGTSAEWLLLAVDGLAVAYVAAMLLRAGRR